MKYCSLLLCFIFLFALPQVSFCADNKPPEAEILAVLKKLNARELELRIQGLLFAAETKDERVFNQLIKMYAVRNKIRPNVFQALIRLNQIVDGKYSPVIITIVKEEISRLQGISEAETYEYIAQFIGLITERPDPATDEFVAWILSNLNEFCSYESSKQELEIKCVIYFALQGKAGYLDKLITFINSVDALKHSDRIIRLFIKNKDPRIFKILVAEMESNPNPSVFFVETLFDYSKAINKEIPTLIKEKMNKILADFDNADKKNIEDL